MDILMITADNVRHYIDKFLDGATSNAEEKALYLYFRTHHVTGEMAQYRDMFAYFEAGMPDATRPTVETPTEPQSKPLTLNAEPDKRPPRLTRWIHYRRIAISSAACVVLALGAWTWQRQLEWQQFTACYEGSYMIVDGQRITDLRKLKPQILATLSTAESIEEESITFMQQRSEHSRQIEDELLHEITDPELHRQLEAIMQ